MFLVCLAIVGMNVVPIKATLPVNAGMTPEQVVKLTYPQIVEEGRNYKYTIIDDYMFLCVYIVYYQIYIKGMCEKLKKQLRMVST